jgi:hypothetical protein
MVRAGTSGAEGLAMNPPSRALGVLATVLCLFSVLTGCAGKQDSTTGSPVPDGRLHNPQTALE